jgi:hypothetical protein
MEPASEFIAPAKLNSTPSFTGEEEPDQPHNALSY